MVHVRDDALYVNIRSNTSAKNTFNFPFQLELTEAELCDFNEQSKSPRSDGWKESDVINWTQNKDCVCVSAHTVWSTWRTAPVRHNFKKSVGFCDEKLFLCSPDLFVRCDWQLSKKKVLPNLQQLNELD